MTGDELERAIDFILKSQARAEARIERNEEQLARNEEQLSRLAEYVSQLTQQGADSQKRLDYMAAAHASLTDVHASLANSHANLVRVLTQTLEAQARINEQRRAGQETLRTAMVELTVRQTRTEEALVRLTEQTAGTDRRLEALIKIVEEGRGGGH